MKRNPRKGKKTAQRLSKRIRDFGTMKPRYEGQYHKPGSLKK